MNQIIQHSCQWLNLFAEDPRIAIKYLPNVRTYIIPNLKKHGLLTQVHEGIAISYCPWCATQLPKDLTNEWFAILKKEYGLDDPWNKEQALLIPDEFKTDEWWKKRGL